jgi:hypothetical protein
MRMDEICSIGNTEERSDHMENMNRCFKGQRNKNQGTRKNYWWTLSEPQ